MKIIIKLSLLLMFLFSFGDNVLAQVDYINIVKNDLKKSWKTNKEVAKIYENKGNLFVVSKNRGILSKYIFSNAKILKGDLNGDGIEDHVVIVVEEGGGGGGNVEWNNSYVIYNKNSEYIVKQIEGDIINPPKNDGGCYFNIENIKNGFLHGKLSICKKRGVTKYDDVWEEIDANCKIVDNRLQIVE